MSSLQEVKKYWQDRPLHSYELSYEGEDEFFEKLDHIKRTDIEKFALGFWNFNGLRGKKILDVGCGPGWFTIQYVLGGAEVCALDLTFKAAETTKKYLSYKKMTGNVLQGNAEELPFGDNSFDFVFSAGVLHHTPRIQSAFCECLRVLKPGGKAKIALYHKGILHHPLAFGFVRVLMRSLNLKHPGADLSKNAKDVDDFIRQYDGMENPIGIGKTTAEWSKKLKEAGFIVGCSELHYFPKRFLPFHKWVPNFVHFALDRCFGTLVYFDLMKSA